MAGDERDATAALTHEENFDRLIGSYVSADRTYDAVLLLSGGKDSAYILHRMRREFPELRILCVTVNNGFMSALAIKNSMFLAEKLNMDLLVISSHIGKFARTLRQAFLDLKGRGSYGVVDKADGDLIFEIGRRVCADMKIPLMLAGLSWVQLKQIFGTDDFKMNSQEGVLTVFPLAVWRTSEQKIKSTVRSFKLMLRGSESPIVSNSDLILSMSVVDVLNNGYCSFEPEFAQMVRHGKADRKRWLHTFELLEFAVRKGFLDKDLRMGLGRLNLSITDVVGGKP